jgi:ATP-dependent Clp protease ATP-binding subunit ClpC
MMNKHLPDKSIDIIDEAAARISTLSEKLEANKDYKKIEDEIQEIRVKIEKAIEKQDYFGAAEYKEREEKLKNKLKTMRHQQALPKHLRPTVEIADVGRVLSDKMGIPLDQITESEVKRLATLDEKIKEKVHGQDKAIASVVRAIRRSRLSMVEHKKPIASFLFL